MREIRLSGAQAEGFAPIWPPAGMHGMIRCDQSPAKVRKPEDLRDGVGARTPQHYLCCYRCSVTVTTNRPIEPSSRGHVRVVTQYERPW
jgi:hypothetical protein